MSAEVSAAPADKGPLEKLLSPIADVRRGESVNALLLTLLMFLLLAGYYMLKTAREVFILSEGGAEVKSYASAGQAILLLGLVPAYGAFASRVSRVSLVTWVSLFFVSNIVLFGLANSAGVRIGFPYFLWVVIFNVIADSAKQPSWEAIEFSVPWLNLGIIFVVVYGAALLTSLLPAVQASRVYPAQALRYE